MYHPTHANRLVIDDARPRFFADRSSGLFWLSDRQSGLVLTFKSQREVEELYQHIKRALDL